MNEMLVVQMQSVKECDQTFVIRAGQTEYEKLSGGFLKQQILHPPLPPLEKKLFCLHLRLSTYTDTNTWDKTILLL